MTVMNDKFELRLSLKEKWYRMIESGEKKEEYRDLTPYLSKRIFGCPLNCKVENCFVGCPMLKDAAPKKFTHAHFTLGYPKRDDEDRHMIKEISYIRIGCGREDWGAEKEKEYFVIGLNDWP